MKWINISEELLEMLDPYAEWFFQQDLDWINEKANKNEKNTKRELNETNTKRKRNENEN